MTLRALKEELAAIHAHDLTPVNVGSVEALPGCVILDGIDRDADALDGLREDLAASEAAAKEAEAEADGLRDELDRLSAEQTDAADMQQEIDRFRQAAADWASEVQVLRAELSALRKRKGVPVGLLAHWRGAYDLINDVAAYEGRHREAARGLIQKIQSMF
jgi:DNA repair exonuclease SbcCD ATPase subunit